jgi:hypothetical protein
MTQFDHTADLPSLLATIAASPIVVPAAKARDFADWCRLQQPADIDLVILGWLRSQARQPRAQA